MVRVISRRMASRNQSIPDLTLNPFPERKGLFSPLPFREGGGGRCSLREGDGGVGVLQHVDEWDVVIERIENWLGIDSGKRLMKGAYHLFCR